MNSAALLPSRIESYAADIRDHATETGSTLESAMASLVEPSWISDYVMACMAEAGPDEPVSLDMLAPFSPEREAARQRARASVREAVLSAARVSQ